MLLFDNVIIYHEIWENMTNFQIIFNCSIDDLLIKQTCKFKGLQQFTSYVFDLGMISKDLTLISQIKESD